MSLMFKRNETIIKNFFLKMKGHVGMSKPKKRKNKIGTIPYQQN